MFLSSRKNDVFDPGPRIQSQKSTGSRIRIRNTARETVPLRCAEIRPDGDVELSEEEVANFNVPSCPKCKVYPS